MSTENINTPMPDSHIAVYVAEVSKPGIPYVNHSHVTLARMYDEHGRAVIDNLLDEYWDALRTNDRA